MYESLATVCIDTSYIFIGKLLGADFFKSLAVGTNINMCMEYLVFFFLKFLGSIFEIIIGIKLVIFKFVEKLLY